MEQQINVSSSLHLSNQEIKNLKILFLLISSLIALWSDHLDWWHQFLQVCWHLLDKLKNCTTNTCKRYLDSTAVNAPCVVQKNVSFFCAGFQMSLLNQVCYLWLNLLLLYWFLSASPLNIETGILKSPTLMTVLWRFLCVAFQFSLCIF